MKHSPSASRKPGFTLIEVLAAVTIIGIMVFLAIPNITAVRRDAEENMAISKGSMLNMAVSSYIQAVGISAAKNEFAAIASAAGQSDAQRNAARYAKISPYLAYAPATIGGFMPSGYEATLPSSLDPVTKTVVSRVDGAGQAATRTNLAY
jgi:prepilin-type N-terminal cleavage/methylation domain-containing protein